MPFVLPRYKPPDFSSPSLAGAPPVCFELVLHKGVAPANYHATSIFPEYFQVEKGKWVLPAESRMDCVVVMGQDGTLSVKEFRHLALGDAVACGRRENGEDGIFVHVSAFGLEPELQDKFAFRTQVSRETSFSIDYDELYELMDYERECGFILWVLGPALAFDRDARTAFKEVIETGYVHGLLAGNALATHDIEASLFGTALGQGLYSKHHAPFGHYKHLDAINRIRAVGSIKAAVDDGTVKDGIFHAIVRKGVPFVLSGSIRDDGPLPEVTGDVYLAQDQMRALTRRATTVIAMATQLHSIATGNMLPAYRVTDSGIIRPVFFYSVDMSEFAAGKLANRGSLTAHTILTNAQDFMVTLHRGLQKRRL